MLECCSLEALQALFFKLSRLLSAVSVLGNALTEDNHNCQFFIHLLSHCIDQF